MLSFRDISQRYALDRLKDEFISTVSHELRTPLTSIRGALGLLSSGILGNINDKAANLLRIAVTNSDRLVRLINDILDLERIQSGTRAPHLPLPCSSLRSSARPSTACSPWPTPPACSSSTTPPKPRSPPIPTACSRSSPTCSPTPSSSPRPTPPSPSCCAPAPAGVTLSVIDQGRGIPADKLEAIFGRFQQVDASDSRQKGGSGLGLAICRTIVLQHSGRIWAERNPVRGSTFRVFLPYKHEPMLVPVSGAAPARAPSCWPTPIASPAPSSWKN